MLLNVTGKIDHLASNELSSMFLVSQRYGDTIAAPNAHY